MPRDAEAAQSISRYERFRAIFRPRKTDDLRYDAEEWIGRRALWEPYWIIEEGEPYSGEWACGVVRGSTVEEPKFAWVPSGDLERVAS